MCGGSCYTRSNFVGGAFFRGTARIDPAGSGATNRRPLQARSPRPALDPWRGERPPFSGSWPWDSNQRPALQVPRPRESCYARVTIAPARRNGPDRARNRPSSALEHPQTVPETPKKGAGRADTVPETPISVHKTAQNPPKVADPGGSGRGWRNLRQPQDQKPFSNRGPVGSRSRPVGGLSCPGAAPVVLHADCSWWRSSSTRLGAPKS